MRDAFPAFLGTGFLAAILGFACCFGLLIYLYMALCIYKIAKKCNVETAWLSWIPIVQIVPLLQASDKPIWWIVLFFIPLVNIVIAVLVWMAVAERLGKPPWVGILIIVPIVGIFIPAYLAFSK